MEYWYWLVFGMALMAVEIFLPSFTALWFGSGAIVVGLLLRAKLPKFAQKVQPVVKWFSLIALLGFIVGALAGNWSYFVAFLGIILVVVTIHDAVALAIGYGTAYVGGLGTRERKQ